MYSLEEPKGLGNTDCLNKRAFEKSSKLHAILQTFESHGKWVTAICASPIALKAAKIGFNKSLTCYPSMKEEVADTYNFSEDRVVVDGKMITSRGPGTSFEFGLTLVKVLVNDDMVTTLKSGMLVA